MSDKPDNMGQEVYSNFGHIFMMTEEKIKSSEEYHQHSAWDFCGYVWYNKQTKQFHEEIWIYHNLENTIIATTLKEVVEQAIDIYGEK